MSNTTRRGALSGAATLFAIGTAAAQQPQPQRAQPQLDPQIRRPQDLQIRPVVRLRRNVGTMAINDPVLVSYRAAVVAMRALPASDKRNWENQARIHQDYCPHGNWFFLPWHRAYLYAFERICQQMSGDANFRLPYWNWTSDRTIPAALTVATVDGQPNPLRHSRPNFGASESLPDSIVGPTVIEDILDETTFGIFASGKPTGQNSTNASWQRASGSYGPLEGTPHNSVHGALGGDMGTFMSPRDPIFWLHHCNVDRLWDSWTRRGNANTSDVQWRDFRFGSAQFVRQNGTTAYEPQCRNLESVQNLGYEYFRRLIVRPDILDRIRPLGVLRRVDLDRLVAAPPATPPAAAASGGGQVFRVTLPANVAAAVARAAQPSAPPAGAAANTNPEPVSQGRVLVRIAAVPPSEPGAAVRVFIGRDSADVNTPTSDPHYVGTFAFFGDPSQMPGMVPSGPGMGQFPFVLEVTRTAQALARAGRPLGAETNIVLVPVGVTGGSREVTVREVTLAAA
jgi:tyrosinase